MPITLTIPDALIAPTRTAWQTAEEALGEQIRIVEAKLDGAHPKAREVLDRKLAEWRTQIVLLETALEQLREHDT